MVNSGKKIVIIKDLCIILRKDKALKITNNSKNYNRESIVITLYQFRFSIETLCYDALSENLCIKMKF